MFKRMSILLRHTQDSRDLFATKWEHHGTLVSQLPWIRSYLQNHVLEEFRSPDAAQTDGIVELRFDVPEHMALAFADPKAVPVKQDEPGFLGHGTGYALANDSTSLPSLDGAKLIVVMPPMAEHEVAARLREAASTDRTLRASSHDEVRSVIARPEMERGPQEVSGFLHLLYDSPEDASNAARQLFHGLTDQRGIAIFRVRTVTVIQPAANLQA